MIEVLLYIHGTAQADPIHAVYLKSIILSSFLTFQRKKFSCFSDRQQAEFNVNQQYRNSGVESPYTEVMERIIGL